MARVFEGQLTAAGLRFVIVVSRFNSFITERLLAGATDALTRAGAGADMIDVIKVPGSWEVPLVAAEVALNYMQLRGFQQQIVIAQDNLKAQQHTAEITRQRFKA